MSPLNIVLSSVYHISAYTGGNEQYTHNLAIGLTKLGQEIYYLTSNIHNSQHPYKAKTVKTFHFTGKPLPSFEWIKVFNKLPCDIFHATGSGLPMLVAAWYLKNIRKIPTILTYQGHTNPKSWIMKLPAAIERILIPSAFSAIITTSPVYRDKMQKLYPYKKIVFIPMMVANHFTQKLPSKRICRSNVNISLDKKIILFTAKIDSHHYYKGLDILIKSAQYLPKNYQILIIGEGEKKHDYIDLINELNLKDKIKCLGYIEDDKLPHYFKAADVFVLPSTSDSEGFGLVLVEAMYVGTQTITTTVIGSAPWFKKEKVTTLIKPNDPHILAKAIIKEIKAPNKNMTNTAEQFAQSFNLGSMSVKTLELYQSLV